MIKVVAVLIAYLPPIMVVAGVVALVVINL